MPKVDRMEVAGFKSIRHQKIELGNLNVLIGANGSGKSNLVAALRLLNDIVEERLQVAVRRAGGADRLLHHGRKVTEKIALRFEFGKNAYACELVPTTEDSLVFADELCFFHGHGDPQPYDQPLGRGHLETALRRTSRSGSKVAAHVIAAFESWKVFHFHDTSESAPVKQLCDVDDDAHLRPDGGNLAAFLFRLKSTHVDLYQNIVDTIRLAAPFFRDFELRPFRRNERKIKLEWRERSSDAYFDGHSFSDGTLRLILLATLLLQPEPPATILIDEPELGLHPLAVAILADLLQGASKRTQLLVATQSVTLVNHLAPNDLIVVERENGESSFRRLRSDDLAAWVGEYALGELWEKNLIGGRPGVEGGVAT